MTPLEQRVTDIFEAEEREQRKVLTRADVPGRYEAITPQWLTGALRDCGALDGCADDMATQLGTGGVVERAAIGLADRGTRRGNDNGFTHESGP